MARFFAYVRADDELPNADAEKLSTAIKADVEALVIRTYPGLGLTVDAYVELDEPSLISVPDEPTEPPAPSEPVIPPAGVDPTAPTEPEPAPPVAPEPAPLPGGDTIDTGELGPVTTQLFAADGVTELTAVDPSLEADQNVVARDAAGNGYDATGVIIDPVVVDAPIVEPVADPIEAPVDTQTVGTSDVGSLNDVLGAPTTADPVAADLAYPLYVVDGDVNTVHDPAQWPPAGVHTPDLRPLFHFAGDTPGGTPAGDGVGGIWHAYDGPIVPDEAGV